MTRTSTLIALLAAFTLSLLAPAARAADGTTTTTTVDLWPGKAPGETGNVGEEKVLESKPNEKPVKRVTNVTKPTVTVFPAPKDKATGAAVVIAPGGGYHILAWDLEGEEVAAWLNSIGVTGVVLKYRVPRRPDQPKDAPPVGALQDAQRAISVVRTRAGEWGIDPKRIGLLGFSAGGHLTAWASTAHDMRAYEAVDDADKASCRPDFSVLLYPAYLVGKDGAFKAAELPVTKDTPPAFFAHAADDRLPADNSIEMFRALRKANVPAELHVYASGGHGFGLRNDNLAARSWPAACEAWMRGLGLLKKGEGAGAEGK